MQKKRHYRNNKDSSRSESPERIRDRPDRSNNNRRSTSRHRRNSRNRSPRNRSPRNRSRSPRRDNRYVLFEAHSTQCILFYSTFFQCNSISDLDGDGHHHKIVGIKIETDEVQFVQCSEIFEIVAVLAEIGIANRLETHAIEDLAIDLIEEVVRWGVIVQQAQK